MLHVGRQDELGLYQGEQEHRNDDHGYLGKDRAPVALDHEQRDEGNNGRQHSEGNRNGDFLGALDRGLGRLLSVF